MSALKILLVEDDPRIVSFIDRGLIGEGHKLVSRSSGHEAIEEMRRISTYDLIILDLLLPDMHGHAVCRWLREHRIWTPILMLTALDGIDDIVLGLEAGADDYLTKPFDFDELVARVRSLHRRSTGYHDLPSSKLRVGELEVNVDERKAYLSGRELDFTETEFKLLATLMRNTGKAMSRSDLLELVWQTDKDPLTNIVDVYIRHLRSKIGSSAGAVAIETIRGYGYRMSAG